MVNRRDFLGMTVGAGASLALTPELLRALQPSAGSFMQQKGKLMQRAIPSSGEMLPVISYGARATDGPAMKDILRVMLDNGGRIVDVLHGGPEGEEAARKAASEMGVQNKLFWTTNLMVAANAVPALPGYAVPPKPHEPAAVKAAMEEKFAKFKVPKIDLVMMGPGQNAKTHLAVLTEMKKEGRVRYIGVTTLVPHASMPLGGAGNAIESIMRNEAIDFVAADYSVGDRRLEEKILPLALERKIGVMAYFPFDRARGLARVGNTPLPEWAAEFDAKTWAQFFLKYVLSHPAIVTARVGTTKPHHMLDNIGGGIGRLPDEATRKRMAQLIDTFPQTPPNTLAPEYEPPRAPGLALPAAVLDRYVGEYIFVAAGQTLTIRRDGDRLLIKSGNAPEGRLIARTETRFATSFPLTDIAFVLDAQGRVTGAFVEGVTSGNRIHLERK